MNDEKKYRDSRTGEYVDEAYAKAHPDTTVAEDAEKPDRFSASSVNMIHAHLSNLGWNPRDADGADFQRGEDAHLRFKVGTAHMEVTTLVMLDGAQINVIRATSWSSLDRMMMAISGYVDQYAGGKA